MIDHHHSHLHWAHEYLGIPYVEGADGPNEFDCWGLVRDICKKHLNQNMPLINIGRTDNHRKIQRAIIGWVKVAPPYRQFDIITMRGIFGRHVGICVEASGKALLLHAEVPQVQLVEMYRLNLLGYKDIQGWRYQGG